MPPERKQRKIVKLLLSPHNLARFVEQPSPASTSQKATEKPSKKDKKLKKSASSTATSSSAPKEPPPPPPPSAKEIQQTPKPKESKKSKKIQQGQPKAPPETPTGSSITLAPPKPAGSGIKIKFNVNTLKNAAKENSTSAAVPQTPSTSKAAAALTAQAITPAPITAPATSSRPAGLSNLPPLQTKVGTPTPALPSTATPSVPKIRLKASFSGIKSATVDSPKAQTPKTPIIKLKSNASRPTTTRRAVPIGYGYDSEAEDREEDPAIEEQFILRMPPGEDCEYIRSEIEKKDFGKSTDVWFKFKDDRRAIVSVRGRIYSATLVDLPCIIESNKTIDKGKNIFKTADISQMLLVGDRLIFEDQALSNTVPNSLANYPHGITPPMHWARRRRFRKRAVNRNMDKVEEAVEKLLAADAECEIADYELLTEADLTREADEKAGRNMMNYEMGEEDADGEVDMTYEEEDGEGEEEEEEGDEHALDLMDFEGELTAMMDDTEHVQPETKRAPAPISSDEDEDDDDDEEEEDNDGDAMDLDPGMSAEKLQLKEEMADLERAITVKTRERDGAHNQIVRQRIQNVIDGLKAELELKKSSLEETA
ncbi:hypothetical protein TWF225_002288 [Orbilia oligospora]|nr:hypothetical protein TWF225_002288 [Orbilia oligospora]KAF3240501.1 hypothetical protein TWF217_000789 [Orbilia oligospora]KAF3249347.1 hypothetical protein TWF128_007784 [Orbilia oligospora]